jgi:hypothetical protein
MREQKTWKMILNHLSGEESDSEKEVFSKWLNQNEENKILFHQVKILWKEDKNGVESSRQDASLTFLGRFTKQKIKGFLLNQAVGNLIGFVVGMWVTAMFSHYVLEKRGLHNLFGLTGRKRVAVNEIPDWMQKGIAILVGFIVLELINHFFQTKKYLLLWDYLERSFNKIKKATAKNKY